MVLVRLVCPEIFPQQMEETNYANALLDLFLIKMDNVSKNMVIRVINQTRIKELVIQ